MDEGLEEDAGQLPDEADGLRPLLIGQSVRPHGEQPTSECHGTRSTQLDRQRYRGHDPRCGVKQLSRMTRLGAIEFDDCILDALRDDRLVVFAGAGVSMGPPSNLASFWKLTCDIAQGTGLAPIEPLDRFLGQLHHRNVAVHERAAQLLSPAESAPNALHYNLLRLFRTADRVRLVTTNFDLHFETAANALFGAVPDIYRAAALPIGYDFSGIVHVHGALPRARDLVLTDADFGRAYLTEGWARRFLVDVFRRYTVLFVGYSHNDVVMNYLARALPADSVAGRFALTDGDGNWELRGIKPICFVKGVPISTGYHGSFRRSPIALSRVPLWRRSRCSIRTGGRRIIPTSRTGWVQRTGWVRKALGLSSSCSPGSRANNSTSCWTSRAIVSMGLRATACWPTSARLVSSKPVGPLRWRMLWPNGHCGHPTYGLR
jgi:hypothetical protein